MGRDGIETTGVKQSQGINKERCYKMKIDAAFLCHRVEARPGGMINAIGINSLIRVRQLPHDLNLTLVLPYSSL